MPQVQLPFFPKGTTEINSNLAFEKKGGCIMYFYGHLPVFSHDEKDLRTFRMITSQFYINGTVKQAEICRAFGVTSLSVKRAVKLYKEKGAPGFFEKPKTRGPAVLTETVLNKAQEFLDQDLELSEVAEKLGIKKDTLRKAVLDKRLRKPKKKS